MSNYWERRAARQMHQQMQKAEDYLDELAEYYLAASLDLQDKAKDILRKFRLKHNLTQYEAEQILANIDPADIKGILERLAKDPKNKAIKDELTTQAQAARIRNLETLFDQVKKTTESLAERFKKGASKLLKKLGLDAWYKAVFNLQKQTGSGWKVKGPTNKLIEKAVKTPWTGSGFSERIWGNTEELEKAVKKEIMKSLLTGRPIEEAAKAINDQFGKGMFNARRLMRTEAAYITNQMALEGYKSQGVEKYVYVAILDLRTSKICQSLDKKRFLVKNAQVGVNFPPMHPFCRSTTVPWVSDALLRQMKQKAIDPRTGKRVTVPGDMTYQEWYKQFVQGQPAGDSTIQQRNLTRDQYDRYKERLGDDFPYTYDEFIRMKSDKRTWAEWRRRYKAAGKATTINAQPGMFNYGGATGNTAITFSDAPGTFTSGSYKGLFPFKDITNEWKAPKPWNKPIVTETDTYIAPDGKPYKVDGNAVIQEKRKLDEIEAADIFSKEKATEVVFQPKVNQPEEVKSPDIKTGNGIPYEIKTSRGPGEHAFENIVKTAKGQANKVILNLNHTPHKGEEFNKRLKDLIESEYIDFINEIVIIKDYEIYKVYSR